MLPGRSLPPPYTQTTTFIVLLLVLEVPRYVYVTVMLTGHLPANVKNWCVLIVALICYCLIPWLLPTYDYALSAFVICLALIHTSYFFLQFISLLCLHSGSSFHPYKTIIPLHLVINWSLTLYAIGLVAYLYVQPGHCPLYQPHCQLSANLQKRHPWHPWCLEYILNKIGTQPPPTPTQPQPDQERTIF